MLKQSKNNICYNQIEHGGNYSVNYCYTVTKKIKADMLR